MDDNQAIQMMQRCIEEIRGLRWRNNDLAPKAEAYDIIHAIINLLPRRSEGHAEDLVWRLEKEIEELRSSDNRPPEDTTG